MWLLCFGLIGGLLLLYGGQELLRRGRGGKTSQNGLIALLVGMVLVGCALFSLIAPAAEKGGNILAAIPIRDETKLVLCGVALVVVPIGLIIFPSILQAFNENNRKSKIMAHKDEWGGEVCQTLVEQNISIGMTEQMVRLGWGNPNKVEDKELTEKGKIVRWVYGEPRKNVRYIWFTNGKVTKVQG
jgi:hypothetical protein